MMKLLNPLYPLMASGLISFAASAVEQIDGQYVWQFQSGEAWPSGYNQATGKPDSLIYARDEYSAEFFQRIQNALPEARINEAFITGDEGSTIHLVEDCTIQWT